MVDGQNQDQRRVVLPLNFQPSSINQTMAECRGLAPLARGHALVSTEARLACPVDIPNWSAWGDLHSQGYSILSRTGLLFPVNHTPVRRAAARRTKVGRR